MPHRFRFGRSTVAYWLLGLCNNYGYVVMLSAAHDMLSDVSYVLAVQQCYSTLIFLRDFLLTAKVWQMSV